MSQIKLKWGIYKIRRFLTFLHDRVVELGSNWMEIKLLQKNDWQLNTSSRKLVIWTQTFFAYITMCQLKYCFYYCTCF